MPSLQWVNAKGETGLPAKPVDTPSAQPSSTDLKSKLEALRAVRYPSKRKAKLRKEEARKK